MPSGRSTSPCRACAGTPGATSAASPISSSRRRVRCPRGAARRCRAPQPRALLRPTIRSFGRPVALSNRRARIPPHGYGAGPIPGIRTSRVTAPLNQVCRDDVRWGTRCRIPGETDGRTGAARRCTAHGARVTARHSIQHTQPLIFQNGSHSPHFKLRVAPRAVQLVARRCVRGTEPWLLVCRCRHWICRHCSS